MHTFQTVVWSKERKYRVRGDRVREKWAKRETQRGSNTAHHRKWRRRDRAPQNECVIRAPQKKNKKKECKAKSEKHRSGLVKFFEYKRLLIKFYFICNRIDGSISYAQSSALPSFHNFPKQKHSKTISHPFVKTFIVRVILSHIRSDAFLLLFLTFCSSQNFFLHYFCIFVVCFVEFWFTFAILRCEMIMMTRRSVPARNSIRNIIPISWLIQFLFSFSSLWNWRHEICKLVCNEMGLTVSEMLCSKKR